VTDFVTKKLVTKSISHLGKNIRSLFWSLIVTNIIDH